MDAEVLTYIETIAPEHRPLFDRVHALLTGLSPDVVVTFSYKMPTYEVNGRRLYVGAWRHGISFYGWSEDADGGFVARHPDLVHAKGTIRLRLSDAVEIPDDELAVFFSAALGAR